MRAVSSVQKGRASGGESIAMFHHPEAETAVSFSHPLNGHVAGVRCRADESEAVVACKEFLEAHARCSALALEAADRDVEPLDFSAIVAARRRRSEALERARSLPASSSADLRAKLAVLVVLSSWFGFECSEALEFASEIAQETSAYLELEGRGTCSSATETGKPLRPHWRDWFSLSQLREGRAVRRSRL